MQVTLLFETGRTWPTNILPTSSISSIKKRIKNLLKNTNQVVRLFVKGIELDDNNSVSDYDIHDFSEIECKLSDNLNPEIAKEVITQEQILESKEHKKMMDKVSFFENIGYSRAQAHSCLIAADGDVEAATILLQKGANSDNGSENSKKGDYQDFIEWTEEEDNILYERILRYGFDWKKVKEGLPRVTQKEIKHHWKYTLLPKLLESGKTTEEVIERAGRIAEEWSSTEEERLLSLWRIFGNSWIPIARNFPGRTVDDIKKHWEEQKAFMLQKGLLTEEELEANKAEENAPIKPTMVFSFANGMKTKGQEPTQDWTAEEDSVLMELSENFGISMYGIIAAFFYPHHTVEDVYKRLLEKNDQVKSSEPQCWTKEEDEELVKLVKEYGKEWNLIATKFPRRTIEELSTRWKNTLRMKCGIIGGRMPNWTDEEDDRLLELLNKKFPWNVIAREIGRTADACQTHYKRVKAKRKKNVSKNKPNLRVVEEKSDFGLYENKILTDTIRTALNIKENEIYPLTSETVPLLSRIIDDFRSGRDYVNMKANDDDQIFITNEGQSLFTQN